jgi:hypothetical protein
MGEIWGEILPPVIAWWSLAPKVGEGLSPFTLRLESSTQLHRLTGSRMEVLILQGL